MIPNARRDHSRSRDRLDYCQEALTFRSYGFSVFPLRNTKKPATKWKRFQDRPPTDREIGEDFALPFVRGLAAVTGRVSGGRRRTLCCRDFDSPAAYEAWATLHPDLAAALPTAHTPRPGVHVWAFLRGPDVYADLGDGELRADSKHYTALPPSEHPNGRYAWRGGPPLLSDFPTLDIERTGFLDGRGGITSDDAGTADADPKTEENQYGLCPVTRPIEASSLGSAAHEIVLRTQPTGVGTRNGRLLYLARSLRDLYPARTPASSLSQLVFEWWRLAWRVVGTKGWADTWTDFKRAWSRAEVPISVSRPIRVMTAAASTRAGTPRENLLAACRAKARDSPDGSFYLSCRTAAAVVGVKKSQAANLLTELAADGSLVLVEPGTRGARSRMATVFRLGRLPNAGPPPAA